ncbi:MAG: sodium:solute symporter [Planctomycetota bacterium]
MNFAAVDWTILVAMLLCMVAAVQVGSRRVQSVADFLVAGRTAGRYLLSVSQGMAALGAISVVAFLEQNYVAGFPLTWWGFSTAVVVLILSVSGFVIYRFRQTRSLTLAEFFERRYSRNFRVFVGILAFVSGIINFGIFPAVGARFFIHFIGLPTHVGVFGLEVSTFPLAMLALLSIALFFVYSGGQVAVIIADFLQGILVNVVFIAITFYLLTQVSWPQGFEALSQAPEDASLINPFKTGHVQDFNFWYFLIGTIGVVYVVMSWQGTQAYNASARSAHEAKMGAVLNNWRGIPQLLFLLVVAIIAFTILHHPDFVSRAADIDELLAQAESEAIRNQLRVPTVLAALLPAGLMGCFGAVMIAAFISTHDSYLHSWGSIFIQDVIMPFRKTPYTPQAHLRVLRWSILGVAVFIFLFSLLFQQSEYIFLFFAITGAIFAGGSGSVLIGGLYWRRGTTAAAWSAMIVGSSIAVAGIITHQLVEDFFINGQMFWGIAMAASTLVYLLVSLGGRQAFDLDRLLHRGEHRIPSETRVATATPRRGLSVLGMGKEFTRADRILTLATYVMIGAWVLIFAAGTIYNLTHEVSDAAWASFWKAYVHIQLALAVVVILWFTAGGIRDIRTMLRRLSVMERDDTDDGLVRKGSE